MRAQKGATGSGDGDAAQRRRAHALACLAQCHGLHVSQVRQYSYFSSTSKASKLSKTKHLTNTDRNFFVAFFFSHFFVVEPQGHYGTRRRSDAGERGRVGGADGTDSRKRQQTPQSQVCYQV